MNQKVEKVMWKWKEIKSTSTFHDAILFIIFVGVSAVFWFILALNDSAQDNFNVKIHITNLPDSVTFISDIPEKMHVSVRDKGNELWRNGVLKRPTIHIDFREFSDDGVFRFSHSDMLSALKGVFGSTAQITSLSLDSLRLLYTTRPGRKVPIVVNSRIYPASGNIMDGLPYTTPTSVFVYGSDKTLDTIKFVTTELVEMRNLSESAKTSVAIQKIPGVRIMPSEVDLNVPIEPLVRKEAMVSITPINVPEEKVTLLLFPSKVPVSYYVAMSHLNDDEDSNIELVVDYDKISEISSGKLPVELIRYPDRLQNLTLNTDSVEYAIVKN